MMSELQSPPLSQAGHSWEETSRTLLRESTDSSSFHYLGSSAAWWIGSWVRGENRDWAAVGYGEGGLKNARSLLVTGLILWSQMEMNRRIVPSCLSVFLGGRGIELKEWTALVNGLAQPESAPPGFTLCTLMWSGVIEKGPKGDCHLLTFEKLGHLRDRVCSSPHWTWVWMYVYPMGVMNTPCWFRICTKATSSLSSTSRASCVYFKALEVGWSDFCPSCPLLVYWNIGSLQYIWNVSSGQPCEAKAGPARLLVIALFFLPSHCVFLEVPSQAQCVSPETHSTVPAAFNSASLACLSFQKPVHRQEGNETNTVWSQEWGQPKFLLWLEDVLFHIQTNHLSLLQKQRWDPSLDRSHLWCGWREWGTLSCCLVEVTWGSYVALSPWSRSSCDTLPSEP